MIGGRQRYWKRGNNALGNRGRNMIRTRHLALVLMFGVVMSASLVFEVFGEPPEPEGWVYGETSVSGLSLEEKASLLGVAEGGQPPKAIRLYAQYSYPPRIDWRDRNGADFTTSIKDQGKCGACSVFAVVASIESRLEIWLIQPRLNPDLSEADVFYCGCGACCGSGWWNYLALDYIVEHGISDEACFPYQTGNPPCELCGDRAIRTVGLSHWVGVGGPDEMKQAIASGGPISVVMDVYLDFFFYKSGIYCPTVSWLRGAHAVEIVGYDDEAGYWIAKNSWGTDWGEEGWFRIGYDCGVWDYGYVPFVDAEPPILDNKSYLPLIVKRVE